MLTCMETYSLVSVEWHELCIKKYRKDRKKYFFVFGTC
jgi:hypothetical protein